MTAHAYSEDQLVEQPAIGLLAELGWQTLAAQDESFGASGNLGRETRVLRAEGAAQARGQLDLRGGHRSHRAGRSDRQDLQGGRRGLQGRGR